MKGLKKFVILCLVICTALFSASCGYGGYRGNYKDAYTLICAQVPGILGARKDGPRLDDPQIFALEKDNFGRELYLYLEDVDDRLIAGIVQKREDSTVYFYPEQSTLAFVMPDEYYNVYNKPIYEKDLIALFNTLCDKQQLDKFKQLNDWNSPFAQEKCDSAKIDPQSIAVRWGSRTDEVNLADDVWFEQVFALATKNGHELNEDNQDSRYFDHASIMTTDAYGRKLYYVEGYYYVYSQDSTSPLVYTRYFLEMVAIINPDGSFNPQTFMVEISNMCSYHEQISQLKTANGWGTPLTQGA